MELWIDAQLSPAIALWINSKFPELKAKSLTKIGLRDASDLEVFQKAKETNAVIISKDSDFIKLLDKFGAPPKVIWVTCGNTSNERLRTIFSLRYLRHWLF